MFSKIDRAIALFNRTMRYDAASSVFDDHANDVFVFSRAYNEKIGREMILGDIRVRTGMGFSDRSACSFKVVSDPSGIAVARSSTASSAVHDICCALFIVGVMYPTMKRVAVDNGYYPLSVSWKIIRVAWKDCEVRLELEKNGNKLPLEVFFRLESRECTVQCGCVKSTCEVQDLESRLAGLLTPFGVFRPMCAFV